MRAVALAGAGAATDGAVGVMPGPGRPRRRCGGNFRLRGRVFLGLVSGDC